MYKDIIQEVSDFFTWYKSIYGPDISVEGNFNFSRENSNVSVQNDISLEKQNMPDVLSPQITFNEHLVHQDHAELKSFFQQINQCTKCSLHGSRTNFVFGMGNPHAEVMFVGEAPGRDEDIQGLPFVGKAGQLLDKMLFALKLRREQVYIANVLKCRPPNNRDPLPDEVVHCEPHLKKQIEIIKPKVIVALGRISAQVLLKKMDALSLLRQNEQRYENIPFVVTYHPAALLRNPGWKVKAWQDLQKINRYLT